MTEIFLEKRIIPHTVTGYSSGFYAAAYAAGCFDFEVGLNVVKLAGEILIEESKDIEGRMAVMFGLSRDKVEDICRQAGEVDIAIYNTPSQIIISGEKASVESALKLACEENVLDTYIIPGSVAYHSRFTESSRTRLLDEIEDAGLKDPRLPIVSYLTLEQVRTKAEFKQIIAEQLSKPVKWVELIRKLGDKEECLFVEMGPGSVISRTIRWINRSYRALNTGDMNGITKTVEGIKTEKENQNKDILSGSRISGEKVKVQSRF
jgi:malonyl CoA-acyl carrier protein transacylase